MSSNIANDRKSNYFVLGTITLFILIFAFNLEKQRSSHQSKFLLFGCSTKITLKQSEMHGLLTKISLNERNKKLCTKFDYFLLGHKFSWATAHFVRWNGIKMQSKENLHNGIKRNKEICVT